MIKNESNRRVERILNFQKVLLKIIQTFSYKLKSLKRLNYRSWRSNRNTSSSGICHTATKKFNNRQKNLKSTEFFDRTFSAHKSINY